MKTIVSFTVPYALAVKFDELAPPRMKSKILEELLMDMLAENKDMYYQRVYGSVVKLTFSIQYDIMTRFRKGSRNQSAVVTGLIREWVEKNDLR